LLSVCVSPLIFVRRLMKSPCCLCSPLIFWFSLLSVSYQRKRRLVLRTLKIIFSNYKSTLILNSKFRGTYLKPLILTILTRSLSLYCYQKDERAKPGNLLTNNALSPFPLSTSLSLSLSSHNSFLFKTTFRRMDSASILR
jgi:hypothetical protein